jgi:enamine deaminase RidA (YjgF/YER057c/UK114 family)
MAGIVEKKLQELGIALQEPRAPMANYVPFVRTGDLLHVSGQICLDGDGKLVANGRLGDDVSVEEGQKAARVCAINLLAQVKAALGDLDKVKRVVRLGGFINSAAGFTEGPKVMNGASDGLRRQRQACALDGRRRRVAGRCRG